MNVSVIVGRIANDIELRYTGKGIAATEFAVAVNKDKEHTDFLKVKVYGRNAEIIKEYCNKGDNIGIRGCNRQDKYEDKDGNKKSIQYILAEQIMLLGAKKGANKEYQEMNVKQNEYNYGITEDDYPF